MGATPVAVLAAAVAGAYIFLKKQQGKPTQKPKAAAAPAPAPAFKVRTERRRGGGAESGRNDDTLTQQDIRR